MSAKPLPCLSQRFKRELAQRPEAKPEEIDLESIPDDLLAIGSYELIVAWLLKKHGRNGER